MRKQQGVGLPEVLIGLVLSSFISLCLIQLYLNIKQQYHGIQRALEEQTDLQLAADLIRNSVRSAGFTPCLGVEHLKTIDQRNLLKELAAIEVGRDGSSLILNRMNEHFDTLIKRIDATTLLTSAYHTLQAGRAIIIADCYHAEVQYIKEITAANKNQRIVLTKPLAFAYHEPVYVGEWLEETYFIKYKPSSKAALFYHHYSTEELTPLVNGLSAIVEEHQASSLVHIRLTMEKAGLLAIDIMGRNK